MCLSWSNSPFPMCLCECKADKYWHLFCKNQSETHFVLGLYSSSSSSKSLTRAWNGINWGTKLYIYFSGFGWPHADCLLSELQGNCQSELVPIVIYCVGLRWQFFCLTRKLGFDIYRAVPIQVIHKPKFALLLPGKPTQESEYNCDTIHIRLALWNPWKSAIFLLKPTFKEFRSWRMSFNSISVNLKEKYEKNYPQTLHLPWSVWVVQLVHHFPFHVRLSGGTSAAKKCWFLIRRNVFS